MARGLRSLSPSLLSFLSTQTTQFPPASRLAMLPLLGSSENMLASHLDRSCFFPPLGYREFSLLLSCGIKMLKRSERDVSREKNQQVTAPSALDMSCLCCCLCMHQQEQPLLSYVLPYHIQAGLWQKCHNQSKLLADKKLGRRANKAFPCIKYLSSLASCL